jgi:hypothetical protein
MCEALKNGVNYPSFAMHVPTRKRYMDQSLGRGGQAKLAASRRFDPKTVGLRRRVHCTTTQAVDF